jgi:Exostosin family
MADAEPEIVLFPGAPRGVLLMRQAYAEEGLECPTVDERVTPTKLLFPRSYVERVEAMPATKVHDYTFLGTLYRPETYEFRKWILDFARERFTDRSYLLLSQDEGHERLGSFDHTGDRSKVFVPKEVPRKDRARFNSAYFEVLRRTEFSLCPAGDQPWSMRFFEAVMCRSIPVVSDAMHSGRNDVERAIGYHFALRDEEHTYREDLAEENFQRFLQHQTLMT